MMPNGWCARWRGNVGSVTGGPGLSQSLRAGPAQRCQFPKDNTEAGHFSSFRAESDLFKQRSVSVCYNDRNEKNS
jgi:hypothetical protein